MMRTKFFLMMLAAIVMGSQVTLFAQEKKETKSERRQFNKEQMLEIQCNQIIKGLALDDATTAKFMKEMLPGVTINSRLRADDYGKRHFDSNGHLMGDYESGYQNSDHSDQARFFHRFSTLLFAVETLFQLDFSSGRPAKGS